MYRHAILTDFTKRMSLLMDCQPPLKKVYHDLNACQAVWRSRLKGLVIKDSGAADNLTG